MSTVRRIAFNTGWILLGSIINGLIALGLNVSIARYLGAEMFGNYSFVFAFLSFFAVIANLGLDTIVVREIAKFPQKANLYINQSLMLKTWLSIAAAALAVIIISFLPYPSSVKLGVLFASLTLIFTAYSSTFSTVFQAHLEMKYKVLSDFVSKLIFAGLIWYVVSQDGGFVRLIIAMLISIIFNAGMMFLMAWGRKCFVFSFIFDKKSAKYLLKEAWPLALAVVFASIYYRIDVINVKSYENFNFYRLLFGYL